MQCHIPEEQNQQSACVSGYASCTLGRILVKFSCFPVTLCVNSILKDICYMGVFGMSELMQNTYISSELFLVQVFLHVMLIFSDSNSILHLMFFSTLLLSPFHCPLLSPTPRKLSDGISLYFIEPRIVLETWLVEMGKTVCHVKN
jgi:hypothetical protein